MTGIELDFSNFNTLAVGFVTAGMAVLGAITYFSDPKNASNRIFFLFSLSAIVWSVLNYLFFNSHDPGIGLLLIRGVIASATWLVYFLFLFLFTFPKKEIPFSLQTQITLTLTALGVSILNFSFLVFKRVTSVSPDGGITGIENGFGIFIFGIFVFACVLGGIYAFFKKLNVADVLDKKPMRLVLSGILFTFFLLLTFNFILPAFFNNPHFVQFGAFFIFPLIVSASLALLRYKFLNVKTAAVGILTALLAIVVFFETIFVKDATTLLFKLSEFTLVLVFGILLIRGVTREVEQREEIQRLAEDLRKANERLKELDKLKSQFLSIASHDLRAPLTAVRNFMSLLLEGTYGKLPTAAEEGMHQVFDKATEMAKSVDNYLNVSRIEQGRMKYDFENTDLVKVVSETADSFKSLAEKKGLVFTFRGPMNLKEVLIKADVAKLHEVFSLLIDNSIKYTPKGSISISVETKEKLARVIIKDTGVGISKETIPKLFQLFSTDPDSHKVNTSSTGVGLYVVKAHINAHKGTVRAESEGEGKGSTFVVELPISIL